MEIATSEAATTQLRGKKSSFIHRFGVEVGVAFCVRHISYTL